MCVVAAKYFPEVGWVGVKNRDRNYKPTVHIKQSWRKNVERLYLWDEKTKYSEGVNEYGVAILSAATAVKTDEKEGDKSDQGSNRADFYSPDGRRIRSALFAKTPEEALAKLIEVEIPGNTLVFNRETCILLEGSFPVDPDTGVEGDYVYKHRVIKQDQTVVRTNHGIWLPKAGYQLDSEEEDHRKARISSDARMKRTRALIKQVEDPDEMMQCISCQKNKNKQLNPLRTSKTHGKRIMVTTGQLMICASEKTMHYRPIWSEIEFKYTKLDSVKSKTYFEVVSSRKLLTFKEWEK